MAIQFQLPFSTTLLAAAFGLVFAAGDAQAAQQYRDFVQNATGACQSALPVFDGQIRKRPLALQNEGTASAFVTCSFMGTNTGIDGVSSMRGLRLMADNNAGSAVVMTCTLVTGYSGSSGAYQPYYFPRTLTLPPNSKGNTFVWDPTNDLRFPFTTNVSCNLPVGTGLTLTRTIYIEDVGA